LYWSSPALQKGSQKILRRRPKGNLAGLSEPSLPNARAGSEQGRHPAAGRYNPRHPTARAAQPFWRNPVQLVCLDLEGVLVPEIWIEFAQRTGIPELRRTTRDEPDYDVLMKYRLDLLKKNKLGLPDIQKVIAEMGR
jgi:hypothetical protein